MKPKKSNRWPERSVETFFDAWNNEMAYILGYFAADGSMYKNKRGSCYVSFTSTDKELIQLVKLLTQASNAIESYKNPNHNWKQRYVLQIGSKKLYNKLLQLDFTPKKSLTLSFPVIPETFLGDFLRGYFDGDGCASFAYYKRKQRNTVQKILNIRIRCGSKKFIQKLQNKITKVTQIATGRLYFHGGAYELVYGAKDVLKLYSFMYPKSDVPCLQRKRNILIKGFEAFNLGS